MVEICQNQRGSRTYQSQSPLLFNRLAKNKNPSEKFPKKEADKIRRKNYFDAIILTNRFNSSREK